MSNGVLISPWLSQHLFKERKLLEQNTAWNTHSFFHVCGAEHFGAAAAFVGGKIPRGAPKSINSQQGLRTCRAWKTFSSILHSTSQPCRVLGAKMNLSPSEALTALFNAWGSSGNIHLSVLGPHFAVAPASAGRGAEALCGGGLSDTNPYPQGTCCETHGTAPFTKRFFH